MANPVLNERTYQRVAAQAGASTATMTVEGAVNKTAFLLLILMATATWTWTRFTQTLDPATIMPQLWGGLFGGFILAMVTVFLPQYARFTAPLYAALEGLFLGGLSAIFNTRLNGIAFQAAGLTVGVLVVMLVAYRTGLIKVTDRFRMIVIGATGAIALLYLVSIVLSYFSVNVPFINDAGTFGIIFSLVVVGIAAMNLALDFDFIDQGVNHGAPKLMEWYAAFGLLVTLVWLYLEILRLLSKLRRR